MAYHYQSHKLKVSILKMNDPWTVDHENNFYSVLLQLKQVEKVYRAARDYYDRQDTGLFATSISVGGIASLAGWAAFAAFFTDRFNVSQTTINIITIITSILALIFNGILRKLSPGDKSFNCSRISTNYDQLYKEIKMELVLDRSTRMPPTHLMRIVTRNIGNIHASSTNISSSFMKVDNTEEITLEKIRQDIAQYKLIDIGVKNSNVSWNDDYENDFIAKLYSLDCDKAIFSQATKYYSAAEWIFFILTMIFTIIPSSTYFINFIRNYLTPFDVNLIMAICMLLSTISSACSKRLALSKKTLIYDESAKTADIISINIKTELSINRPTRVPPMPFIRLINREIEKNQSNKASIHQKIINRIDISSIRKQDMMKNKV